MASQASPTVHGRRRSYELHSKPLMSSDPQVCNSPPDLVFVQEFAPDFYLSSPFGGVSGGSDIWSLSRNPSGDTGTFSTPPADRFSSAKELFTLEPEAPWNQRQPHPDRRFEAEATRPPSNVTLANEGKSAHPQNLVFDSSMNLVTPNNAKPKSSSEKIESLQLKRLGGACLKHKSTKKRVSLRLRSRMFMLMLMLWKCRCHLEWSTPNTDLPALVSAVPNRPPPTATSLQNRTVVKLETSSLEKEANFANDAFSATSCIADTTLSVYNQTATPQHGDIAQQGLLRRDNVLRDPLVFTCPFLLGGCTFLAVNLAECVAHANEHQLP